MYNFTLANFYSAFKVNALFMEMVYNRKECLRENVYFNQIAGSFPFNTWNGGNNSCLNGNIVTADEVNKCFDGGKLVCNAKTDGYVDPIAAKIGENKAKNNY